MYSEVYLKSSKLLVLEGCDQQHDVQLDTSDTPQWLIADVTSSYCSLPLVICLA